MTDNEIGDEGAKTMSEMLKVNTTLASLNLEGDYKSEGRGDNKRERENNRQSDKNGRS